MKLLDYLEPMETLPNRFSNLAFWRVLRIFKDKIVDAFTYVNAWGTDIETEQKTQNASLTSHGQMIDDIKEEQITQNGAIESLEKSKESVDGRVTTLESGQKALNEAIESVEKEQSTQGGEITSLKGDVSEIQAEQITQNTTLTSHEQMIATLNDEVSTNSTKIAEQDTHLEQLDLKTYNSTTSLTTANVVTIPISVTELDSGDLVFAPSVFYTDITGYPLFITVRLGLSIYTNPDKTSRGTIYIPVPFSVKCIGDKTRVLTSTCTYKPPYGADITNGYSLEYLTTNA